MSKERPILFNADMVRALLDGRKTQTRRAIKLKTGDTFDEHALVAAIQEWRPMYDEVAKRVVGKQAALIRCPYGKPGDRLWVRETHYINGIVCPEEPEPPVIYRADPLPCWEGEEQDIRWRPSIHMPRWASRITLEVVSVRVERLKSISEADAKAEGVRFTDFGTFIPKGAASLNFGETWHPFKPVQHSGYHVGDVSKPSECHSSARGAFAGLWAAINGADSWNANPWVWVIEFKRVEASQ